MQRVPTRSLALLVVGIALLTAPGSLFTEPAEYRFTVTTPEQATHQPTSTVRYADLSAQGQDVFRAALEADGTYVVRGSENAPDDVDYVTDYYPSPGVFNVTYQGERYVMVAEGPGVNIIAGILVIVARAFGVATVLTGAVSVIGHRSDRLLAGHAAAGILPLGIGLVAPWVWGTVGAFFALVILTACGIANLFVTTWSALERVTQ